MVRERIAEALRSGDQDRVDEAIADWLSGLSTDEELLEATERARESYDLGIVGRSRATGKDR